MPENRIDDGGENKLASIEPEYLNKNFYIEVLGCVEPPKMHARSLTGRKIVSVVNKHSVRPLFAATAILSIFVAGSLFMGAPLVNAQSEETTGNFWENPVTMNAIMIFSFGCVGAIAPEIVRWYQLGQKGKEITVPARFITVSIAFAILGGLIAWVLEARSPHAAFYNGVSLPSIMKTYVGEPIPETTISNPQKANKNPKKREITIRQYLGALSIKRSNKPRHNKQEKKR